jgi:hypothetical protein
MPGRNNEVWAYITIAIRRDSELYAAIQEEIDLQGGEPPASVVRSMLNVYIRQRDFTEVLTRLLDGRVIATAPQVAPAPSNNNADEALAAWREYDEREPTV